jgi:orotidine-5'-phosphate decarboxylase
LDCLNYLDLLKSSYDKYKSILCLGLDPVIEDIPLSGDVSTVITAFYEEILNKILQQKEYPSAIKPNYAFYAQYGMQGIEALVNTIELFKSEGFPVILDVKRGDIDNTASAYAREAFVFFKADAVTLSPYLGQDSVRPFADNYPDKGFYILTKTSNKIVEWYRPGIGSVVGATYPNQLSLISHVFISSGKEIPLLIPGIGRQGGDIEAVVKVLRQYSDVRIHRINSSSGINYAYKKYPKLHYAEAAVKEIKMLNEAIGRSL